jgi:superfamily I DNA and RNA helicase
MGVPLPNRPNRRLLHDIADARVGVVGGVAMDLVIGTNVTVAVAHLMQELKEVKLTGATLYIGYPILSTADSSLSLDAVLTSVEHGVVVFDLTASRDLPQNGLDAFWSAVEEKQSEIELALKARLIRHKNLTVKRELAIPIHIVTYLPTAPHSLPAGDSLIFATQGSLKATIEQLSGIESEYIKPLNASIQQIINLKPPKKRIGVKRSDSKGGILKTIEKEIANLDRWQKKAAIESPEGPQRIRGLAGSGKTVVLALKAAYLHVQHPGWDIVVTFQTRSLYEQFRDLIRRFMFEHVGDEPNWEKLRILHAWGSHSSPGTYHLIANANNLVFRNLNYAKGKYATTEAFEGVCREAVEEIVQREDRSIKKLFDAILIDEAQDFGPSFFQLAYASTKNPKRFVWAYDELQSLKETSVPSLAKLFGKNKEGEAVVKLRNIDGQAHQDIILPVCYRNTLWALTLAHALGFGVYRKEGLIQMFDDATLWSDIGYEKVDGALTPGATATLRRSPDASPQFFSRLLQPEDAVQLHEFLTDAEQAKWVADQIKINLERDELEHSDILVIFPDPLTAARDAGLLVAELRFRGILSHITGVTRGANEFYVPGSIAISGIHRARGNEAPMVYVMNAEFCASRWGGSIRRRSILFTAITRSRAWVRVCGVGDDIRPIADEWNKVIENKFRLTFTVPTPEELQKMRQINRDRTEDELQRINNSTKSLNEIVELIERDEMTLDDIPSELRAKLEKLLGHH